MELTKYKKYLKDDNYVHCTICANYRNYNSFAHRKSEFHQKRLCLKLRKISIYLSQKVKKPIVVHDEQWESRDTQRFCHFCSKSYAENHLDEDFIIENLGCIYHHADSHHSDAVKLFLKRNFRSENPEKYCVSKKNLDKFIEKLPEAKSRYLKKMEILNNMVLKQIKESEEERKKLVNEELQAQACCSHDIQGPCTSTYVQKNEAKIPPVLPTIKNKEPSKIPPWLEDVVDDPSTSDSKSSAPVIGPTIDNLIKHVENQKKKGLSKNRVGANFKRQIQSSSKWLPSFQGVWNQGRRKQSQISFNLKNKKSSS